MKTKKLKMKFIIRDWAGNKIDRKSWPDKFNSFDDAEDALVKLLKSNYETDRGEYEIMPEIDGAE